MNVLGTVHAKVVHHSYIVSAVEPMHHRAPKIKPRKDFSKVRDIVLALVLATGLSTVFLSPFRSIQKAVPSSNTEVLGASITIPLSVTVSFSVNGQAWRGVVQPRSGSMVEAIATAASSAGYSFTYTSRGSSIYLQHFAGKQNDQTGQWVVRLNGVTVNDISLPTLHQSDSITIEKQIL